MKDKSSIDMTHGPLLGKILLFSIPLMASNVLQMLFNAVDIAVVGQFAGYTSLAAVGSTSSIIALFVNSFVMLSVGVNVVIARYLGLTGHAHEVSRTLHTALNVAAFGGLLVSLLSIAASDWMLEAVHSPEDVRPLAVLYLRIYFIGTLFTLVYNFGAAALRAKGDTQRPLIFLTLSGVINVALDLFFVIVLKMAVAGAALATVISQGVSAALILLCLARSQDEIHFDRKKLCMDTDRLREMAYIGIPACIQSALFSLSNIVIQSAINAYSSIIIAGFSAAFNIESFLYLTMNAFHQACQTFTSQNFGARDYSRIVRTVRICLLCTLAVGLLQSVLCVLLSHPLVGLYSNDPAVIQAGVDRLCMIAPFYTLFGLSDILVAGIRGCGVSITPAVINLLGICVFRLIWVAALDTSVVDVSLVYLSYPTSWTLLLSALILCWLIVRRKVRHKLSSSPNAVLP